jgi:ABC-type branched-subunit amino acid transport system substrate-binding protein
VKNKVLLIFLAAVVASSLGLSGCCPTGPNTIVVGMSRSLTGCCAIIRNSAFGALYPQYFDYINTPGIDVNGTYFNVEVKVLNDNSDPAILIANTYDLIEDINVNETVHFLFGSSCPCFVELQAPIANKAGVVLMTFEGGTASLRNNLPSWPYVFMHQSFADRNQLQVLAPILAAEGADSAYIFWEYDCYGTDYLNEAATYFPDNNIAIVGNMSVTSCNLSAPEILLATANASGPDVVCCFCYPDGVFGLTREAIDGGYNFNAWVTGLGGNFGWFGSSSGIGSCADGVICFATANRKTDNNAIDGMKWLYDTMLTPLGLVGQDFWGHPLYWAGLQMWQDAVEAVGIHNKNGLSNCFGIDQTAFKNQLASYDGSSSTANVTTVLGDTWYEMFGSGGGILHYECHPGEIGQWQSGYVEIIGGNVVTAPIQYPKPNWAPPCP